MNFEFERDTPRLTYIFRGEVSSGEIRALMRTRGGDAEAVERALRAGGSPPALLRALATIFEDHALLEADRREAHAASRAGSTAEQLASAFRRVSGGLRIGGSRVGEVTAFAADEAAGRSLSASIRESIDRDALEAAARGEHPPKPPDLEPERTPLGRKRQRRLRRSAGCTGETEEG